MNNNNKIAVAVDEDGKIWKGHFGIAPYYLIYDDEKTFAEKRQNPYGAASEKHTHHDNPKLIIKFLSDCKIFVGKRMGQESRIKLKQNFGIEPFITDIADPETALEQLELND
jgi:predicted Fe-Mo cluster-binding NifX family protein